MKLIVCQGAETKIVDSPAVEVDTLRINLLRSSYDGKTLALEIETADGDGIRIGPDAGPWMIDRSFVATMSPEDWMRAFSRGKEKPK